MLNPQKNHLNANDIYPILDLIRSEIKKNNFDRDRVDWGNAEQVPIDDDQVISIEPIRGSSTYDPTLITAIVIKYVSGNAENVVLLRGAEPAVHASTPNAEYINNVMIRGLTITFVSNGGAGGQTVTVTITRENGYGSVEKVELTYN